MKNYKNFVSKKNSTHIGFFPGSFKPPHKGHFDTALKMAKQNNFAYVVISSEPRDNITVEKSKQVWDIYKKYLPENTSISVIAGSPVTVIYQIVNMLNNGEYVPTSPKSLAPLPDAKSIAETIKTQGSNFIIRLYASQEDLSRYKAFFEKNKIYTGQGVSSIESRDVSRIASATEFRTILKTDKAQARKFLPNITQEDMDKILTIL